MNNIRRFRYVKPIYKKSVILNNRLIINYLKLYKHTDYGLVNNNKKSYSNLIKYNDASNLVSYNVASGLVLYTKPKSELVLYDKSDLGLILYQLNNNLFNNKSNKYLYRYILFKIAYFINFVV
jgi:hypothetical protein